MAFTPFSPGTGVEHSELVEVIIKNSVTIGLGEACASDTTVGFATHASAAARMLGISVGFVTNADYPITPTAYAAGTATLTNVTAVTAASDNQTNAKYKVVLETSQAKKWSAQVDGTVGTTAHSDVIGVGIDVDSANTHYDRVLETTATRTYTTVTSFYGWGTDPADSTRLVVSIRASEKTI
jgi:hypothetical protein